MSESDRPGLLIRFRRVIDRLLGVESPTTRKAGTDSGGTTEESISFEFAESRLDEHEETEFVFDGGATADAGGEMPGEPASVDGDELDFEDEKLLNGIGRPVFMLDRRGNVVEWNISIENLTGVSKSEAQRRGVTDILQPDTGRTLAEMVLDAPENAHEHFDVELVDAQHNIFQLECIYRDEDGTQYHVECSAKPLYQDGELAAVMQSVNDRTEDALRHEAVAEFGDELKGTLNRIASGDLSARAEFTDERGVLNEELLDIVSTVNGMAEDFEDLTRRVNEQTTTLMKLVEDSSQSASEIEEHVEEQSEMLGDVVGEMESFSANMEEVAASSDEIASAAEQARTAAENGLDSSEHARDATEDVVEMSDDLVETVTELEERIAEIEGVLEVIDEVAEQTNMLALNASIEAARAGDSGNGFEVVADEVKQLADETRTHTEDISERIQTIQSQASEATVAVEESNRQIQSAGEDIDEALSALEEIADAVDEAATGIQEVADANDAQADTVQEVMETIETVGDRTNEVQRATDEIVSVMREQEKAINELKQRVETLRRG